VIVTASLVLVVCGAPLAARAPDVARSLGDIGWAVSVVGTPASRAWLDEDAVAAVTGEHPHFDQRDADEPRRGPRPSAVVVCPMTMNSGSKLATGIMDTYAAGVMCEALATGTPITAVLMISNRLWGHPAWAGHVSALRSAGVRFADARSGREEQPAPVQSGTGPDVVSGFDPAELARTVGAPPAG
jgi:phosphopantothenoylcysteine synthetase/decarboxylase